MSREVELVSDVVLTEASSAKYLVLAQYKVPIEESSTKKMVKRHAFA